MPVVFNLEDTVILHRESAAAPGFLFGKSSKLCDSQWLVITAESQHLYTCADYHWSVKTTMVIATIFNNTESYEITSLGNYYTDLSPAVNLPSSTLLNCQQFLEPHDNYSQATIPPPSHKIPSLDSIVSKSDPIDRFLNSKKEVLLDSTRGILEQIYERLSLRDSNIYELDQRISRANSVLDQLDVFELGSLPVIDKRKSFFEKDLMTFEQEKRFEKVACWRDVSRLQGQLLEIKQQIDTQANRQELIGD